MAEIRIYYVDYRGTFKSLIIPFMIRLLGRGRGVSQEGAPGPMSGR